MTFLLRFLIQFFFRLIGKQLDTLTETSFGSELLLFESKAKKE